MTVRFLGEAQTPGHHVAGDVVQEPVFQESVGPQPREGIGRAEVQLGDHHAGGLVDLRAGAPRPSLYPVLAGVGAQPEQHQRGDVRGAQRIAQLGGRQRACGLAVQVQYPEVDRGPIRPPIPPTGEQLAGQASLAATGIGIGMTVLGIGLAAVILGRAGPADRTRRRPGDRRGRRAADVADLDLREARLDLRRALAHATTTLQTAHPAAELAITRSITRFCRSFRLPSRT